MSSKPNKIVILRQEEDSAAIIAAVRDLGYEPLCEPVLNIVPLEADLSGVQEDDALILTSAHAVPVLAQYYKGRGNLVFTVGDNTAEAARAAGFDKVISAEGTAQELLVVIENTDKSAIKRLVYLRGADISVDVAGILREKGKNIEEITAYRADLAENLSISLLKSLDTRQVAGILLYSARGARAFAELIQQYGRESNCRTIKLLSISEAVLESVSGLAFARAIVAHKPDGYGMIAGLKELASQ